MVNNSYIITLHRYYIWANKMRVDFDALLSKSTAVPKKQFEIEVNLYMSYWYGGLFVVIEGWSELGLSDQKIDALLESPNVDLLRRYRNGVFHFQKEYNDKRFEGLIKEGKKPVEWIRQLNLEFGRYFLEHFKKK